MTYWAITLIIFEIIQTPQFHLSRKFFWTSDPMVSSGAFLRYFIGHAHVQHNNVRRAICTVARPAVSYGVQSRR